MSVSPETHATVADADRRARAMDVRESFIVQAPAGSGKTELLVRRFLALLAAVERPEAILAVTFTRKAAAEMRERIVGALRAAAARKAGGQPTGEDVYQQERLALASAALANSEVRGWRLLENSGRLQVFTLDSLCARIVSATPLLSRFGGTPATVENAEPHYLQAARATLRRAGDGSDIGRAAERLLRRSGMRPSVVEERIVEMLGRRDQWASDLLQVRGGPKAAAAMLERFEHTLGGLLELHLQRLSRLCGDTTRAAIEDVARLTAGEFRAAGNDEACSWPLLGAGAGLATSGRDVVAWKQAATLVLTKGKELRKPGGVNVGVGAPRASRAKERFVDLLESIHARPSRERDRLVQEFVAALDYPETATFDADTRADLTALFEVLIAAHGELWLVFQEAGVADFVEVSVRALQALRSLEGAPSDLLLGMDTVIEHILVDEFQDTNRRQCELIRSLTGGWTSGDGRTLFLVGDPMQSIYRFRKAEVGLFLHAAAGEAGGGLFSNLVLHPLVLSVNFRSAPPIIDWVNATFGALLGEEADKEFGGVDYSACSAGPRARPGDAPELILWKADGFDDPHRAEAEGLAELVQNDVLPAARSEGGEEAKVAVLVRSRGHAKALVQALRRRGVRFRGEQLEPLAERPEILDLQSLSRFIVHREDRLSGLALLHSPLVGLTDADLCRLIEPDVEQATRADRRDQRRPPTSITELLLDEQALDRLDEEPRLRAEYARAAVLDARARLGLISLDMIVRSTWVRLGGPQLVDAAGAADCERFFALVGELGRHGCLDSDELTRRLDRLFASVDPAPEIALEVTTVHQAKGLEYDTVVLPSLCRAIPTRREAPMHVETDPATGEMTCCAPAKESGRSAEDDAKFTFLGLRDSLGERAEVLRVLYVACTRAKRRLILSTGDKFKAKNGMPAGGSSLEFLWPVLEDAFRDESIRRSAPTEAAAGIESRKRIRLDWLADPGRGRPAPLALRSVRSASPSVQADTGEDIAWTTSRRYLAVGSVVHALFQRIAEEGIERWNVARADDAALQVRILRALGGEGLPADEIEAARTDVTAALRTALSDERGRWILSAEHEDPRCEWRVAAYESGDGTDGYTRAGIDRTFIDDGVRWVIDYKTNRPSPDQDAAAFMKDRFEHYRPQLESYAHLLAQLDGEHPIRMALYFPLLEGTGERFYDEAFGVD